VGLRWLFVQLRNFSMGVIPLGRGYDLSQVQGDSAFVAFAELRYNLLTASNKNFAVYSAFDRAQMWNKGFVDNKKISASSISGGIKGNFYYLNYDLLIGHQLKRITPSSKKNNKVLFTLNYFI